MLEDRWLRKTDRLFQRLPPLLQGLFVIMTMVGLVVMIIPDLQIGLPSWLRVALFGPVFLLLIFEGIPFLAIRWGRAISWPFRKVTALLRKSQ